MRVNQVLFAGFWFIGIWSVMAQNAGQLYFQEYEFTQFIHLSVNTFVGIEHNCVDNKTVSAKVFNPTNVSTDQWVMEAVNMGVKEICLTAHHEGGFCLWPTNYSEYSLKQSPWKSGKGDILADFVQSCKKYGMNICYYLSASSDCYENKPTPERFLQIQLGMLTEVLTKYGPVNRLWFDHYAGHCAKHSYCPGGFPPYWVNVTNHVQKVSPSTLMVPGPDACAGPGESGYGLYPMFNSYEQNCYETLCGEGCHNGTAGAQFYRPHEAVLSILNPGDHWFWREDYPYLKASELWDYYLKSVGIGSNLILNTPPDTTGQIPAIYVTEMRKLGNAIRTSFSKALASTTVPTLKCNSEFSFKFQQTSFNAIIIMEDLNKGKQSVKAFQLKVETTNGIEQLPLVNNQTIGHKLINILASPIQATSLLFTATDCVFPQVYLRSISIYKAQPPQ